MHEVLLLSVQERVDRDDILLRILMKRIFAEYVLQNVSGAGVDYPMRVRELEALGRLPFFSPFLTVDQLPGEINLRRRRHEVGYITEITRILKDDVPQNHMTFYLTSPRAVGSDPLWHDEVVVIIVVSRFIAPGNVVGSKTLFSDIDGNSLA